MALRPRPAVALVASLLAWSAPFAVQARSASRPFHHARYQLVLPPGWFVAEARPDARGRRFVPAQRAPASDARVVHFGDEQGNYLSVFVDHAADLEADAIWNVRVAVDGASIEIGAEGPMCGSSGGPGPMGPCSAGNGTLEIATIPPLKMHGHAYAFHFGNTRRERGADLDPFRWILGSFRAR